MDGDDQDHRTSVDRYFSAMRRGAAAEDDLLALFADDAVYEEPFSGSSEPAVGRESIRARLRDGWETPLPELQLDVLSVQVDGHAARATWECRSTAFPAPVRGVDEYEFRGGLITRLVVRFTDRP